MQQNHDRYVDIDPEGHKRAGIYSAGLNLRMTKERVIFASVQSVRKRMDELCSMSSGDECPDTTTGQPVPALIRDARELTRHAVAAQRPRTGSTVGHPWSNQLFHRMSYNALGVCSTVVRDKPETRCGSGGPQRSKSAGDFIRPRCRHGSGLTSGEIKAAADQKGMKRSSCSFARCCTRS